ncbi:MAG: hypothetical protein AAF594_02845 [Bacteroidota bacterium]
MTRLNAALAVVLVGLLLVATGCDGEDASLLGEFEASVQVGPLTEFVDGEAVYTVVDTEAGPAFVLGLFVGDLGESDFDAYNYVLFRRPGARPGVGAYAIDDVTDRAVAATVAEVDDADDPREAVGTVLRGVDGTLAVTRVDGYGFLSGTFRFDAEGIAVQRPSEAIGGAASGTFEARYEPPSTFRRLGVDLGL